MRTTKLLASLVLATWATASVAQTITGNFDFGNAYAAALSIPKEFSYNGVPYLVMYDSGDRNTIQVYDENLEVVKRIAMKEGIPFNYQLTYRDQVREVVAVNEVQRSVYCQYDSYDAFLQGEKASDPAFDESCLIITDTGEGTKKVKMDYSKSRFFSNKQMYYAYDYFGMQYPKVYFIDDGKSFVGYQARYKVKYSDWRDGGIRVVDCSEDQRRIRLCNINLNQGDGKTDNYFEVSQTLFNDDASFEYIMPKYQLSANGNVGSSDVAIGGGNEEAVVTTKSEVVSEQKELALVGFQVLSEDGNVVSDITFDNGFEGSIYLDHASVITIGSNVYLAFDGSCNGKSSTIFYKIDKKSPNAIRQVKIAPSMMKLSPTIVQGGSPIYVTFQDANEKGSDIVVVSASGGAVNACHVPAGQTAAQIWSNTAAGMYCISRLQKGKPAETKKVLVK